MLIDHDEDVHRAAMFALAGVSVQGRPVVFLNARSEDEARALLAEHDDIAVILLSVEWGPASSGLEILRFIREQRRQDAVRIVLRTAQSVSMRELRRYERYEISDHRMKAELTRARLAITIKSAIRSYAQIRTIEAGHRGLQMILDGAAELRTQRNMQGFGERLLAQLADLVGIVPHGFVCTARDLLTSEPGDAHVIVAAVGRYHALVGEPLGSTRDPRVVAAVHETIAGRSNAYARRYMTLFICASSGEYAVAFLDPHSLPEDIDLRLIEVFRANASVAFENRRLLERLESSAHLDQLTGLPNRNKLVQLIDESREEDRAGALVGVIDVDHFADINESLGHQHGDLLLQAVASRLRQSLGRDVVVARVGGNSFAVFGAQANIDPEAIAGYFRQPVRAGAYSLHVSVSIGLVRMDEPTGSGLEVLKKAAIGLSRAKHSRRERHAYFTQEMEADTRERTKLSHDLRRSVMAQQLALFYQPQIELATGRVRGAESLLRWRGSDGTFVSPEKFIPVAESSGLIRPIGEWVLRTACMQLQSWAQRGLTDFRVAVNVSIDQFRMESFTELVRAAIAEYGVEPALLELEITESMAMDEIEIVASTLSRLKALGVSIAIDDFGTGFSSLGYLTRLSVDRLKIDRSFVAGMGAESARPRRAAARDLSGIPEMVIRLGHSLGLGVIAEGVEQEHQARGLQALGCDEAQGYFYCEPMDVEAFEQWLQARALLAR
jgi:diguanylate cyclase (GGDEF)-like protein